MCDARVACLICAKNEEKYIIGTLDSLFQQRHPPDIVVVVDDGSSDSTPSILQQYKQRERRLKVLKRKDRGFSALGTPLMAHTYNTGFRYLMTQQFDYLLIIGADTILPPNYVETLLERFRENERLGIISGYDPNEEISPIHARGSGRLIKGEIIKKMKKLPIIYGWETYEEVLALAMGYEVTYDENLTFSLQRPSGKGHKRSYIGWGRAMKELGYHPLYALGRILMNVLRGKPVRGIQLAVGYMTAKVPRELEPLRRFFKQYQAWYLTQLLMKQLSIYRR